MRRAFSNSMGLAAMVGLVLALVAPAAALFAPALAQAETEEQAKDEGPRSPLRWVAETESPRSAQPTGPLYRACGGRDLGLVSVAAQIVRRRLRGMPPPSERQLETLLRAWRAGFVVDEVPITFVERRAGTSKISRSIVLEALWRVLRWGLAGPRQPSGRHPRSVLA